MLHLILHQLMRSMMLAAAGVDADQGDADHAQVFDPVTPVKYA
jgi:hypothetical protein